MGSVVSAISLQGSWPCSAIWQLDLAVTLATHISTVPPWILADHVFSFDLIELAE